MLTSISTTGQFLLGSKLAGHGAILSRTAVMVSPSCESCASPENLRALAACLQTVPATSQQAATSGYRC